MEQRSLDKYAGINDWKPSQTTIDMLTSKEGLEREEMINKKLYERMVA